VGLFEVMSKIVIEVREVREVREAREAWLDERKKRKELELCLAAKEATISEDGVLRPRYKQDRGAGEGVSRPQGWTKGQIC